MLSSFGGFLLSFANLTADTEHADPSQQRESKLLLNYGPDFTESSSSSGLDPWVIGVCCWELCLRTDRGDWNHIWNVAAVYKHKATPTHKLCYALKTADRQFWERQNEA